ncbi:fimbrial chaperone protein [Bordetella trematum]|uniref:Pili assembly chaperone n=1 Tax=Bordetella trematum TaxID=123899 RepID=A0A157SGK5_9BORD|nr:molecular chaperone [Bordetella trematum]AZR92866.1 fimbrial chaperone protein [Bordetella trematum]NNH17922.1 molecular chaperone [Bordetella trematum]SAI32060.1 pili assembly chaperone [Bordetella trematum]SAI69570.1 pili assembly chaperone [Bordetella trematum]SUV99194.1 pili assembly chaperone [Bordetella trematum]
MKKPFVHLLPAAVLFATLVGASAQAGIQLSNTRVVLNEGSRSASVYAKNSGEPVVVQAWIEGVGEKMETPFFITPPLSRFDGDTERSLTISRVGQDVSGDRESYYWVNVLEIPQKVEGQANTLTFATRTRIKLFYRPTAILKAPQGPEQLTWSVSREGAKCSLAIANASPFTVNFARMELPGQVKGFGTGIVAMPLDTTRVELKGCPASGASLTPYVVNEYGAIEPWPAVSLQSGGPATPAAVRQP